MNKRTSARRNAQVARIAEAAQMVFDISASEANEMAFMSKCFIQATLPHSDPGDVKGWGRRNGNYSLSIQPGIYMDKNDKIVSFGVPYGSIPRLILAWLNAEAIRTKSRNLVLGQSFSEFLDKLGYKATGGKKGDLTRVKNQAQRLFSSSLSLVYDTPEKMAFSQTLIAEEAEYFWDPANPGQCSLWDSSLLLSESFFDLLLASPVPLDWRILKAIKQSPMALDLYMWLSYRMFRLTKPQKIKWETLAQQLGSNYADIKNFRLKVRAHFRKINAIWQCLKVDLSNEDYIELKPSLLLIQPSKSVI